MARTKMIARIVADRRRQAARAAAANKQDNLIKGEEDSKGKELGLKTLKEEFVVQVLK